MFSCPTVVAYRRWFYRPGEWKSADLRHAWTFRKRSASFLLSRPYSYLSARSWLGRYQTVRPSVFRPVMVDLIASKIVVAGRLSAARPFVHCRETFRLLSFNQRWSYEKSSWHGARSVFWSTPPSWCCDSKLIILVTLWFTRAFRTSLHAENLHKILR